MSWNVVIGQHRAKTAIRTAVSSGRIPHAWLFTGMEGIGKDAAAIEAAKAMRCEKLGPDADPCDECWGCRTTTALQNSNVKFVCALPSGKGEDGRSDLPMQKLGEAELAQVQEQLQLKAANPYYNIVIPRAQQIKVSSIREIKRDISLAPMEEGWRVIIVSEAHLMGMEAANAFLKTLEEPSPKTLLILTTSYRERMLPTILSRCQEVRFEQLREQEILEALIERERVEPAVATLLTKLAEGSYSRGVELSTSDFQQLRSDVVSFLRGVLRRSPLAMYAEIERLSANNDRGHLERTLSLLSLWLRDAYALRLSGNQEIVVNRDQLKDIQSFNSKFASVPIETMIGYIDEAIKGIRSNAQVPLVFTVLSMRLVDACYQ